VNTSVGTAASVGDIDSMAASFARYLRASNRSPRTIKTYGEAVEGPSRFLAQRGELDLSAPVTDYWPEFGARGKEHVPVSWLLCHKSGMIDTDGPMSVEDALDWDTVTAALAASAPAWEPGTAHGYHAVTYGWLVGEVVVYLAPLVCGGPVAAVTGLSLPASLRLTPFEVTRCGGDLRLRAGCVRNEDSGGRL